MQIYVNPGDDLPIYRQIVREVSDAIAGGRVAPGEQLPSHRDLAAQLVIAPLTVKKAYDELEREGWIEMQRGRGTFVSERAGGLGREEKLERLRDAAERLLRQAEVSGVPYPDVLALMDSIRKENPP